MADYAHTPHAATNRTAKAEALLRAARLIGMTPNDLRCGDSQDEAVTAARRRVRRVADVHAASEETWQLVVDALLATSPPDGTTKPCPHCRRDCLTLYTPYGRRVIIDPDPAGEGNVLLMDTPAGLRADVLAGGQWAPDDAVRYRIHSRACPGPPKPTGHTCPACGLPLDQQLASTNPDYQSRGHPACDRAITRRARGP